MKKILVVLILFLFSINFVNADEKKVKTRGKSQDKEFKKIEINISPDLLDLEEIKKLKKNLSAANNHAIELDKTLDEKKWEGRIIADIGRFTFNSIDFEKWLLVLIQARKSNTKIRVKTSELNKATVRAIQFLKLNNIIHVTVSHQKEEKNENRRKKFENGEKTLEDWKVYYEVASNIKATVGKDEDI